jgi:hypothetical protein
MICLDEGTTDLQGARDSEGAREPWCDCLVPIEVLPPGMDLLEGYLPMGESRCFIRNLVEFLRWRHIDRLLLYPD